MCGMVLDRSYNSAELFLDHKFCKAFLANVDNNSAPLSFDPKTELGKFPSQNPQNPAFFFVGFGDSRVNLDPILVPWPAHGAQTPPPEVLCSIVIHGSTRDLFDKLFGNPSWRVREPKVHS
ncbi:hypothetical protein DVH24_033529 [Malus domestica]|uniref:Uncharacterized protein n=1 Tax=Malus domestica TaxID=3750 RepID=A0A498JFL9_MALDO|nr:hypothetical protein DVH24_033529 [Malus domestica]